MRDRGPRSRAGEDLDLVRGERQAGQPNAAVGQDLDGIGPGGGHDRRDPIAVLPADPRQERLDPSLDQLGFVADQLDGLHVDLVGDQAEQLVALGEVAAGQREPHPGERLADLEAGVPAQGPGQLDGPPGGGHRAFERLVAETGQLGRSARRSGGRCPERPDRRTPTRLS